ncbi:MAG: response regulator transcription factor [Anaerobacillus sp.]|uniref:response regulator transcription factor n=1 Tax=Anaerobacillus sp. TaxID=1872506 RepID=UPI00391BB24F
METRGGIENEEFFTCRGRTDFAKNIAFFLEREGYHVDVAYDGEAGWISYTSNGYDLILLDWTLPKKDGLELCKQIRKELNVPIIMITAKGETLDKIIGLELGADDYIVKPFGQRELLARLMFAWTG